MVCCDKVQRIENFAVAGTSSQEDVSINASRLLFVQCPNCYSDFSLAELLFDFCENCTFNQTMPALPQGAFAACKIRSQDARKMPVAQMPPANTKGNGNKSSGGGNASPFPNWKLMDLSPLKYNSKFMDAIWGHYNRYSPHNMKSNDLNRTAGRIAAQQQEQPQHLKQ